VTRGAHGRREGLSVGDRKLYLDGVRIRTRNPALDRLDTKVPSNDPCLILLDRRLPIIHLLPPLFFVSLSLSLSLLHSSPLNGGDTLLYCS